MPFKPEYDSVYPLPLSRKIFGNVYAPPQTDSAKASHLPYLEIGQTLGGIRILPHFPRARVNKQRIMSVADNCIGSWITFGESTELEAAGVASLCRPHRSRRVVSQLFVVRRINARQRIVIVDVCCCLLSLLSSTFSYGGNAPEHLVSPCLSDKLFVI